MEIHLTMRLFFCSWWFLFVVCVCVSCDDIGRWIGTDRPSRWRGSTTGPARWKMNIRNRNDSGKRHETTREGREKRSLEEEEEEEEEEKEEKEEEEEEEEKRRADLGSRLRRWEMMAMKMSLSARPVQWRATEKGNNVAPVEPVCRPIQRPQNKS